MKKLSVSLALIGALTLSAAAVGPMPSGHNGNFIFLKSDGTKAFDASFENAREFADGPAAVKIDDKWGYIDDKGKVVIEPKFDATGDFVQGAAFVAKSDKGMQKWGMIGKDGTILIRLENYGLYSLGGALVLVKRDGKYAMYNRSGKELLELAYQNIRSSNPDDNIIFAQKGGKFGLFDANGKQIAAPKFDEIGDFMHNKNMWASVRNGDKYGMIDKSGKETIAIEFDEELKFDEYGLAATRSLQA